MGGPDASLSSELHPATDVDHKIAATASAGRSSCFDTWPVVELLASAPGGASSVRCGVLGLEGVALGSSVFRRALWRSRVPD